MNKPDTHTFRVFERCLNPYRALGMLDKWLRVYPNKPNIRLRRVSGTFGREWAVGEILP